MFAAANQTHFSLAIDGLALDLQVLSFSGREAISQPFAFDLELVGERPCRTSKACCTNPPSYPRARRQRYPRPGAQRRTGRLGQAPDPLPHHPRPATGLPRPAHQPAHLPAPHGAADRRPGAGGTRHPRRRLPLPARHPLPRARILRAVRRERPAVRPAPVLRGGHPLSFPAQRHGAPAGVRRRPDGVPAASRRWPTSRTPAWSPTGRRSSASAYAWKPAPAASPAATTTSRNRA